VVLPTAHRTNVRVRAGSGTDAVVGRPVEATLVVRSWPEDPGRKPATGAAEYLRARGTACERVSTRAARSRRAVPGERASARGLARRRRELERPKLPTRPRSTASMPGHNGRVVYVSYGRYARLDAGSRGEQVQVMANAHRCPAPAVPKTRRRTPESTGSSTRGRGYRRLRPVRRRKRTTRRDERSSVRRDWCEAGSGGRSCAHCCDRHRIDNAMTKPA